MRQLAMTHSPVSPFKLRTTITPNAAKCSTRGVVFNEVSTGLPYHRQCEEAVSGDVQSIVVNFNSGCASIVDKGKRKDGHKGRGNNDCARDRQHGAFDKPHELVDDEGQIVLVRETYQIETANHKVEVTPPGDDLQQTVSEVPRYRCVTPTARGAGLC